MAKEKAPKKKPVAKKAVAAKKTAAAPKAMTAAELASTVGVKVTKRLKPEQIRRLRMALPGYVAQLDDAADQLEADQDLLGISDITPDLLRETKAEQKALSSREAILEAVYTPVYQQRLQVDDVGMGMLQKIARRIEAKSEDDPDLPVRWKFLLDFLGGFRGGGRKPKGGGGGEGGGGPGTGGTPTK